MCFRGVECRIPSSTTNLGEGQLDTPDLTLVAQTIFANNLQLRVTVELLVFEIQRLEQRQAHASVAEDNTNRRADSNGLLGTL